MKAENLLKEAQRLRRSIERLKKALSFVNEEEGRKNLEKLINDETKKLERAEKRFKLILLYVRDESESLLLRLRYLEDFKMDDIAQSLNYSLRHAFRLKRRAENTVERLIESYNKKK